MHNATPAYLTPYILIGILGAVAAILFGLHKALQLAGWPLRERRPVNFLGASLMLLWLLAALLPSWAGFYRRPYFGVPTIQYGLLIPLLLGIAIFRLSPVARRIVEALPQSWLVGVQFYRVEGLIFLLLYAKGLLPGAFALPAGTGDVLVGLLAPVVAAACARNPRQAAGWVRAWNFLGLADLIVAVTMGFLTSPTPLQVFSLNAPNVLIGAFPLVLIPVFLVPLSILLHLASLAKLPRKASEKS